MEQERYFRHKQASLPVGPKNTFDEALPGLEQRAGRSE